MRLVRDVAIDDFVEETDEKAPAVDAEGELLQAEHSRSSPLGEQPDGAVDEIESNDETVAEPANARALEALLLGTHHPLTAGRLAELLDLASTKPVRGAIKQLNSEYESTSRSFRIEQVAGGFQLLTLPEFGDYLKKLHQKEIDAKLTKAALETLAIIAYKQPILRADIEAIRGVACGETIRSLVVKHLVKIAGRAEEPGRPILYGTTKRFLEIFGLNTLKDLPQPDSTPKL
jgi:segregation and condensation protein B